MYVIYKKKEVHQVTEYAKKIFKKFPLVIVSTNIDNTQQREKRQNGEKKIKKQTNRNWKIAATK